MNSLVSFIESSNLAAAILDAALKSFVVLGVASALSLGLRRASAATRHLVWLLAVASLLVLPLLSASFSSWQRPLWSVSTSAKPGNQVALTFEMRSAEKPPVARRQPSISTPETSDPRTTRSNSIGTQLNARWFAGALAVWLSGAMALFCFLAAGQAQLRRAQRQALKIESAGWCELLSGLCQELRVRRTVTLLQSARATIPVTWGAWRPIILLPAGADRWSRERQRTVLLHELAHIRRLDALTQTVTSMVCALYWFNPLAWLAARRMSIERERACDDLVLNSGCKASDYAAQLVEIARSFRRLPQLGAIAMARSSGLEQRVTAILDRSRNRNRAAVATAAITLVAVVGLGLALVRAQAEISHVWTLENSKASGQLKRFVAEKKAQASAAARAEGKQMLPEFQDLFAAAEKGNWQTLSNIWENLRRRAPQYEGSGEKDPRLHGTQWQTVLEIWGTFDNLAQGGDNYPIAFGRDIISSIPPGSIYFGGTDPGRFLVTALSKSHVRADPFFTLTQNALADATYLQYLRDMYGARIYIPTAEDSQACFQEYVEDAKIRLKEHKLKPGEDVKVEAERVQVSGQVAVMSINALLVKLIFDKTPAREFYIEESFPLDWMYPHLEPHGLIFKINREPLPGLAEASLRKDHEYWSNYVRPLIGDWLTADTSVQQVAAFAEKVHRKRDLTGFKGDPQFVENDYARQMFAKLRSSIGGLYLWRMDHASDENEKNRMAREADFALRQAVAMCPYSPEAVFKYATLLSKQQRISDAILVAETAARMPQMEGKRGEGVRSLLAELNAVR